MRKAGIVLIVCLLAVAGITAAMAYTSATVENEMEFGIVSTDAAKLALTPNEAVHGNVVSYDEGTMKLEFYKDGFGFQPNSWYYYEDLFKLTNNFEGAVDVYWGWIENLGDFDPTVHDASDLTGPPTDLMIVEMHASTDSTDKKPWLPGDASVRWQPAGHESEVSVTFRPLKGDPLEDYKGYLVIYAEPQ